MKTINIKDITEDTFNDLKTKLPILPTGFGSFECKNPHMLILWRDRFIRFYGSDGVLYLNWIPTNQVEGNEKYDQQCSGTSNHITKYYNE